MKKGVEQCGQSFSCKHLKVSSEDDLRHLGQRREPFSQALASSYGFGGGSAFPADDEWWAEHMSVSPLLKFPIRGNESLSYLSENIHQKCNFRKCFRDAATRQAAVCHQKSVFSLVGVAGMMANKPWPAGRLFGRRRSRPSQLPPSPIT